MRANPTKSLFSMLAISAAILSPAPARASKRLAILPTIIEGQYGSATAADVFQLVAHAAELDLDLELVPYNELVVDGATSVAVTVRECASDLSCIGRALAAQDIQLGLRAIVNFALEPPLVSLSLIESRPPRVIAESLGEIETGRDGLASSGGSALPSRDPMSGTTLAAALGSGSSHLLARAGFTEAGRIAVVTTPPDAIVHVAGDARPTDRPGVFLVRPGRYEISAERADHETAKASVVVTSGAESAVALVLPRLESEGSSTWLWLAIGGAALAGATTAVLLATDPFTKTPREGCVCITTPSGTCVPCAK